MRLRMRMKGDGDDVVVVVVDDDDDDDDMMWECGLRKHRTEKAEG